MKTITVDFNFNSSTPAKRYEARENAGEVLLTYNPGGMSEQNDKLKQQQIVKLKHVQDEPLVAKFKHMFQKVFDKSQGEQWSFVSSIHDKLY